MNRTEWDACKDPLLLLRAMQSQGSERKFRLLACAVADAAARHWGGWNPVEAKTFKRIEQFADGYGSLGATPVARHRRGWQIQVAGRLAEILGFLAATGGFSAALEVCARTLGHYALIPLLYSRNNWSAEDRFLFEPILHAQRHLIHDAFDHRMRLAPLLLGDIGDAPDVQALARAIYADKSFSDMPVLGDALEDAGCDDEEALDHCRNHPLHARGCWVLDAVLCRG